jgi:fibronectin type 3 domain-containing protein
LETISGTAPAAGQQGSPADAAGHASPYIDLSWEPNTEPDLAGYLVYRQLANADGSPHGSMVKLTTAIISAPAYRDVAVIRGQRYIYQVTAVDASGNESAPSAKAQEVVTPELNSPN